MCYGGEFWPKVMVKQGFRMAFDGCIIAENDQIRIDKKKKKSFPQKLDINFFNIKLNSY